MSDETRPDVLVIGSGAAGAALSLRLAEHGARVVCLEQGDWVDRSRLPKAKWSDLLVLLPDLARLADHA